MSNVLPPQARAAMLRRVHARFILTGSIILTAAGVVAILAMMPAYLSAAIPRMSLTDSQSAVSSQQVAQEEAERETASHTRVLLAALASFTKERVPVHTIMTTIEEARPADVSIQKLVYTAGTAGSITLTGIASDRDSVSSYREALMSSGAFDSVSVPVAALVGASEGIFTMTLTGKF